MRATIPNAFRLAGPAAPYARSRVPFDVRDDADAVAVVLGPDDAKDAASVARAIPDADELAEGTMVVVLPVVVDGASLARRVLAALGRGKTIPRVDRCSALLARGYVRIGACVDAGTKLDLAFGFAPPRATTEPC